MKNDNDVLSYPLYLDVSMMISFLASLDDGVAYDASVQRTTGKRRAGTGEVEGGARLPSFLGLLPFDLRGRITGEFGSEDSEVLQLVKRHTEASLFNKLRTTLHDQKMVTTISTNSEDTLAIERGSILELSGVVTRNPLEQLVDIMQRLKPFVEPEQNRPGTRNNSSGSKGRRNSNQPVQNQDSSEPSIMTFMQWMKEDLESADMIDVILRIEDGPVEQCILTLSQDFGTGRTADSLLGAEVRVIGKATRVVREGETASLLRRSILNLMPRDDLRAMFDKLSSLPLLEHAIEELEISPPYLQVLPLAVFV